MNRSCRGKALRSPTIFALEKHSGKFTASFVLLSLLTFFFSSPFGCLGLCVLAWSWVIWVAHELC